MHTHRYYGFTGLSLRPAETGTAVAPAASRPAAEREPVDERDDRALIMEHVARPVGRHGRRLIEEIESYVAFFAIARG